MRGTSASRTRCTRKTRGAAGSGFLATQAVNDLASLCRLALDPAPLQYVGLRENGRGRTNPEVHTG